MNPATVNRPGTCLLAALLTLAGSAPGTPSLLADAGDTAWLSEPGGELSFSVWYDGQELVGHFEKFAVRVELDESSSEPRALRVEVDLGTADMNDREVNAELAEPDWLDSRTHPVAVFSARDISRDSSGYRASGILHLKNIEQSVEIPLAWERSGASATLSGTVILSRQAWQVGSGEWASDSSLEDRVEVRYRVTLARGE